MRLAKLTISALLLTASIFSVNNAHASDICHDSIKAICTDTLEQRAKSQTVLSLIKENILTEAQPQINKKTKEFLDKTPKFRWIKRITQPMRIQNQEIMKVAKVKFPEIDSFINDSETQSKIKTYMARSIDNSNFQSSVKSSMKSIISQVRMINFTDYIDLVELDESLVKNMLMNPCGSTGLEVNAFAIPIKKKDYIVICPGFIINNSFGKSKEEMFENSLFVLGHELGHHIDSNKIGAEPYANYIQCMSTNHAGKFNKSKKDQNFCDKSKTSKADCSLQVVASHAGELIGDVWGMKVINEFAKEQGFGAYESSQLLINGMNPLCGGKDVGLHPSGDFRTGVNLAINPEMNELFSCQEQKQVTCNF